MRCCGRADTPPSSRPEVGTHHVGCPYLPISPHISRPDVGDSPTRLAPLRLAANVGEVISNEPGLSTVGDRLADAWVNAGSPLPAGSLVYAARRLDPLEVEEAGTFGAGGTLYITLDAWTGRESLACAELRRVRGSGRHVFVRDRSSMQKDLPDS